MSMKCNVQTKFTFLDTVGYAPEPYLFFMSAYFVVPFKGLEMSFIKLTVCKLKEI
jgi:hypothetical protein